MCELICLILGAAAGAYAMYLHENSQYYKGMMDGIMSARSWRTDSLNIDLHLFKREKDKGGE